MVCTGNSWFADWACCAGKLLDDLYDLAKLFKDEKTAKKMLKVHNNLAVRTHRVVPVVPVVPASPTPLPPARSPSHVCPATVRAVRFNNAPPPCVEQDMIKVAVKIGLLYRHSQFSKEEMRK